MPSDKFSTVATVQLVVEVDVCRFGGTHTIGDVLRIAERDAPAKLRELLDGTGVRIVSNPQVKTTTTVTL